MRNKVGFSRGWHQYSRCTGRPFVITNIRTCRVHRDLGALSKVTADCIIFQPVATQREMGPLMGGDCSTYISKPTAGLELFPTHRCLA